MDFELTSDQKNFQNLAKDFSDKELKPHAARWDKEEEFPLEAIKKAGDLGAFYRIEKELQGDYRKTTNIIGVQYQYTLKRKNK